MNASFIIAIVSILLLASAAVLMITALSKPVVNKTFLTIATVCISISLVLRIISIFIARNEQRNACKKCKK